MSWLMAMWFRKWWVPVKQPDVQRVSVGGSSFTETESYFHSSRSLSTNKVITSEYTVWNFLPKTLFRQLTRLANFYFLLIGIIQLALNDSPTHPLTSFVPLCCVVALAVVKQAYEDWLRHKADEAVNKRRVSVIKDGKLTTIASENIEAGDIVYVLCNEQFPCDLILLSCDDPSGQCHVMTANLDGETSLKTRVSAEPYMRCRSLEQLLQANCIVEYEKPVPFLYRFTGRLIRQELTCGVESENVYPLGPEQLLPRGAELRNTAWAYGCAVYLGQETKMSLNFQTKKAKTSRLERTLNRYLLLYILGLLAINLLLVLAKYIFARPTELPLLILWGMPQKYVSMGQVVEDFLSFIALTNYVVPISLYVTMEVMKMISAYFFKWDLKMFDGRRNLRPKANTSELVENLGQIEQIFSDKTGTLTENCMQFRYCSAGGKLYRDCEDCLKEVSSHSHRLTYGLPVRVFGDTNPDILYQSDLDMTILIICLCHSARVECQECGIILSPETLETCRHSSFAWNYLASSPDELAFLEACRRYSVIFCGRNATSMVAELGGQRRTFSILAEIPWSPARKKMSVIIKDLFTGIAFMLVKGADCSVMKGCCLDTNTEATEKHLRLLSEDGYRVMACAFKVLDIDDAVAAKHLFRRANSCVSFTEREKMFSDAADQYECNLKLVGATAVEDKLQEGVAETFEALANCGIRRWVLTGDREETAINICRAAKLYTSKTQVLYLTGKSNISECTTAISDFSERLSKASKSAEFGLVFDGSCLALIWQVYPQQLVSLATHPNVIAVLGCRLAPLQKAQVISLMRNTAARPVCAAIGDGANDVSMILEADVGIAVFSSEGTSAARSCDYAIPSFLHLRRVLFVHGYYFYTRLAVLVLFFFYKNLAFSAAQIYYVYFSLFSAQSLFESFHLTMYNVTFTSLPIFIYSIVEKSHPESHLLRDVSHYVRLRGNSYMSAGQFIFWNFTAIFHSVVIFYGCLFTIYTPTGEGHDLAMSPNGTLIGNYAFGQMTLAITLFVVLLKLAVLTRYWCWPQHAALWFTVTTYLFQLYIYEHWLCSSSLSELPFLRFECDINFLYIFQTPSFYLIATALVFFALLPDLVCRVAFSVWSKRNAAGSLLTPVQELCSPGNSQYGVAVNPEHRPASLISNEEWVELLEKQNEIDEEITTSTAHTRA